MLADGAKQTLLWPAGKDIPLALGSHTCPDHCVLEETGTTLEGLT